jgi:hypothetical protein
MLHRLPQLLKSELVLINNRLNLIRLNRSHHLFKLRSRSAKNPSDGEDAVQGLQRVRLGYQSCHDAYQCDDAFPPHSQYALVDSITPTDVDNVVETFVATGKLPRPKSPVGFVSMDQHVVHADAA